MVPSIPVQAAGSWAGASAAWTAIPGTTSPPEARPGPPAGHTHPGGLLAAKILGVLQRILGPPPLQGTEVEAPARSPSSENAAAGKRAHAPHRCSILSRSACSQPASIALLLAAVCHDSQPALCRRRGLLQRRSRGASRRRSRASADVNASRDPLRAAPASGNSQPVALSPSAAPAKVRSRAPACVRALASVRPSLALRRQVEPPTAARNGRRWHMLRQNNAHMSP